MVTTCYRPNERGKAQALNDFLVFGTTATSSFMAGFLQENWGWYPLNWFSLRCWSARRLRRDLAAPAARDAEPAH